MRAAQREEFLLGKCQADRREGVIRTFPDPLTALPRKLQVRNRILDHRDLDIGSAQNNQQTRRIPSQIPPFLAFIASKLCGSPDTGTVRRLGELAAAARTLVQARTEHLTRRCLNFDQLVMSRALVLTTASE